MLRDLTAKILEHADGALPLLEGQQLRGGVVLRIGADLRFRGHAPDAQEILHRPAAIPGLLLRLAFLVYAGGEALGEIRAHLVILAGERARLQERGFRLGIIALVEARLRDDRPRDALLRAIHRRLARENRTADPDRARPVPGGEDLLGCARQDPGAVRVLRKALREPDSGVHGARSEERRVGKECRSRWSP